MPLLLPPVGRGLEKLRRARCYLGDVDGASRSVEGWILLPDAEITGVEGYWNGSALGPTKVRFRPDVAARYPRIPHAGWSGFQLDLEPGQLRPTGVDHVTVVAYWGNRPVARAEVVLCQNESIASMPVPPPEMIEKVQGDRDGVAYRTLGYKYSRQFVDAIARYRSWDSVRRLLDWGCGSGRVAAAFLAAGSGPEVFGCDPDGEAVAWCQANLRGGHFTVSAPVPPLAFADSAFDVVLSLGVFAGFGPAAYDAWLPELRRALAPGGLLLASVQGVFAAAFEFPPQTVRELLSGGILDSGTPGYYVTPDYVRREWSKHFEILEHLEGEINADQDLVVVRRPAEAP